MVRLCSNSAAVHSGLFVGSASEYLARQYAASLTRLPLAGSVDLTYLQRRLTNVGLEAVNTTIQWVKKTARGFRNVEHFKTAIYFHCRGLDLYPH
ncbi:transposase [Candidatus Methylomirabilis sp.]|uniref:transposase n=1 Tax=Candidatus Methylomirabilis sp. TaxID=2032687 RepID=UPI003075F88B